MAIKKSELINIIQELNKFSNPKIKYEQYETDAVATADFLFYITFEKQDLKNNMIIDLGCGSGNLTIAALLLGAKKVVSIDIDKEALHILQTNLKKYDFENKVEIINTNICDENYPISNIIKKFKDTEFEENNKIITISNPPFGVKNKGADIAFLSRALEFSDIIYSIHLSTNKVQNFLKMKIDKMGGFITERSTLYMTLNHTYKFHKKNQKRIKTDVYRIIPKKDN